MRTNVKLKVKHDEREEYCRVKLDSKKFPYIVIDNEKIIINKTEFPYETTVLYGMLHLEMDLISGQEELEEILSNPELTVDKLSLQQQRRM